MTVSKTLSKTLPSNVASNETVSQYSVNSAVDSATPLSTSGRVALRFSRLFASLVGPRFTGASLGELAALGCLVGAMAFMAGCSCDGDTQDDTMMDATTDSPGSDAKTDVLSDAKSDSDGSGGQDGFPPDDADPSDVVSDVPQDTPTDGQDAPEEDGQIPTGCLSPSEANTTGTDTWQDALGNAKVTIPDPSACHRTYSLTTTATLRDPEAIKVPRIVNESEYWPTLRSGHDMFDALYALTLEEVRQNSVDSIRDGAFNNGAAVPCEPGGCFETGRLWKYVWTRDTAYALDLGLAAMDGRRGLNSLSFKLSERRGGGDLQIIQDTGSGGSYPVSTDRVVWAVGAGELLRQLHGDARTKFRDRALLALKNTIEHDREVVFDPSDGLYRGEQSFLDWREQTYPPWTAQDVVHIAMSKSLSTNLLHFRAIQLASELAKEVGDTATSERYSGYAEQLLTSIQKRFWLEKQGLFSTYVTTGLDPSATVRYDLLGSSLAVLFGVATKEQAVRILANYPHYGHGAPVAWPQQQFTPIYHNRGEWPFVSAYWLKAAKRAGNATVANRMIHALLRGTAINLSNMENFEAGSGAAWKEDGTYSGPVVNSERQLWSVAGFLSMVHQSLFGLEGRQDGLYIKPFVPAKLRDTLFGGTNQIILNGYPYRNARVNIVLHLPSFAGTGVLFPKKVELDGTAVSGNLLPADKLTKTSRVDVYLDQGTGEDGAIRVADQADWRQIFGPRTPEITGITADGPAVKLALQLPETEDVYLNIYRDGVKIAEKKEPHIMYADDTGEHPSSNASPCYAIEAVFFSSGNHSQHSAPYCWWGTGSQHITTISAQDMQHKGGTASTEHGRFHYSNWGDEDHTLTVESFTANVDGTHLIQAAYGNGAGPINTGITCAVKRVVVQDTADNSQVATGFLVMPHLGDWSRWSNSNFVPAKLKKGKTYRIVVKSDSRAINMSAFAHFEAYTGGNGGKDGVYNRVNIAEIKILAKP